MKPVSAAKFHDGITFRQAALVAGFAYLLNPVSYAEVSIYPKLVSANNAAQTVQNISVHLGLFAVAILCYWRVASSQCGSAPILRQSEVG